MPANFEYQMNSDISSGCVPCHILQQQTEDVKPEGNIDHSAIWVAQDLKVILFKFLNVPYRERYSIETPEELKISISELKQTVSRQANRKEQQNALQNKYQILDIISPNKL